MDSNFFIGCTIYEILIDSSNQNFTIIDKNTIFSKNLSILFYLASGITGTYSIPTTTEELSKHAFTDSQLSTLIIPENIKAIPDSCFYYSSITNFTFISSIISIGKYSFSYNKKIKEISLPSGLKEIPSNAFSYCTQLKSITIPEGVENISKNAFSDCTSLSIVYLPSTIEYIDLCFSNCATDIKLFKYNILISYIYNNTLLFIDNNSTIFQEIQRQTEHFIPSTVKKISDSVFEGNTKLNQITFENANNIEYIGKFAFSGCTNLQNIIFLNNGFFGSNDLYINDYAFSSCKKLKLNLTFSQTSNSYLYIGEYAFRYCELIQSLSILQDSNCLLTIEGYAFSSMSSLTDIYISQEKNSSIFLTKLSFYSSKSISDIIFKQSSYSSLLIQKDSFSSGNSIKQILIEQESNSNITLESNSFSNCDVLESFTVKQNDFSTILFNSNSIQSDNIQTFSVLQKKYCEINISQFSNYPMLSKVTFYQDANSIISFSDSQFKGFSELKSVILSNCIEVIPSYCFDSCSSLETLNIPSSCKAIESYAFYNCSQLKTINIPLSITNIGTNIFQYCDNLENCLTVENKNEEFRNTLKTRALLPSRCICDIIPQFSACSTFKLLILNNLIQITKFSFIFTLILSY